MKKLMWMCALVGSIFGLGTPSISQARESFELVAELTGTLPSDPVTGDIFGVTVTISDGTLMVGAPGASPNNQDNAGAVYFFQKGKNGEWTQSQDPFTIPVAANSVSDVVIAARHNWLFVPAPGTPLSQPSPAQKDFSGAVLVLKRNGKQWNLVQTITNPAGPVDGAFSLFGFNLAYDGGNYVVFGGAGINTAYFYKLDPISGQWQFAQAVTLPDNVPPGYIFPTISGNHVLFTQPAPLVNNQNGVVYAYELVKGQWTYLQTLTGSSPISPVYGNGDFFGEFLSMSKDWALISAPLDNSIQDCAGAAYFFHFEKVNGKKQWVQKQKVYSDQPSALFGFGLSIRDKLAVIGDCGRTVNGNIFQGAGYVLRRSGDVWLHTDTLIDPNGRAYDFFGGGGVDINQKKVAIGTDPYSDTYLPPGFPGKRAFPYDPAANNGRAVLWQY